MVFHLQSIWLIGALTAFVYGLVILVVRPTQSDYLSRTLWFTALSTLSVGMGFLLRSGITRMPEPLRLMMANTLAPLGLGFAYRAIAEMKGISSSWRWHYLPPVAVLGSTLWFSFIQRNITICQLVYNLVNAALLLGIVALLLRRGTGKTLRADRLATVAFLLLALSTLGVVALFVVKGDYPVNYDFNQPRAVFNVLVSITFTSLIDFITLLMIYERLNENLIVQALHDPLTGVYNRRAFEEIAFREFSGSRRSGLPIALIVCDIDHFKMINDTFGHVAGDEVLSEVARVMRAHLRDEDSLCRWGGDEFVALLPRAGEADAVPVSQRIALAFQNHEFSAGGVPVPVSVSLGVAAGDRVQGDLPTLLNAADRAMYRAKQRFKHPASQMADEAEAVPRA